MSKPKRLFEKFRTAQEPLDSGYLDALELLLQRFKSDGLEVTGIFSPYLTEQDCIERGLSLLGVAKLEFKGEELLYRFPYPTERGTFIVRGKEYSPTYKVVRINNQDQKSKRKRKREGEEFSDLTKFHIHPAEFVRVRQVLEQLLHMRPHDSNTPEESKREGGLSTGSAVELEGSLNLITFPHLHPVEETNPLSEVSARRKIFFPGGEHPPRGWRYIHDESHRKKLCPLETPESEDIGLRLFLARGARIKYGLTGCKIEEADNDDYLGLSASLVPFLHHTDGARAMMGGKNLKQALPLEAPELPLIKTGWEKRVGEESRRAVVAAADGVIESADAREVVIRRPDGGEDHYPLVSVRPSSADTPLGHQLRVQAGESVGAGQVLADWPGILHGELALGKNALVAYMPFDGYNIEDGIVVSESFSKRFTSRHLYEYVLELAPGEAFTGSSRKGERHSLTSEGVILVDKDVYQDSLLARKQLADGTFADLRYDKPFTGKVEKAFVQQSRAIVWVEALRRLEVGDKLTGRHGNKGVVTKIMPDVEMPYFRVNGQGHQVEVILSPMGIVSRMNLGQLLETHYSWLARAGLLGEDDQTIGDPFRKLDVGALRKLLKRAGLEEGKAELFIKPGGHQMALGAAVVGYQYLAKLNHLARNKYHVRTGGRGERYSGVTEQPVKGRRLGGGQRLGEMEVWALLGHSAFDIMDEALSAKSDDLIGRKMLEDELADPAGGFPPKAHQSFPETLRVLDYYLRGLCLKIEFLSEDGKETRSTGDLSQVWLRRVTQKEIKRWAKKRAINDLKDLDDEKIFGRTREEQRERMGFIELAHELPHPLFVEEKFKFVEERRGKKIIKNICDWRAYFERMLASGDTLSVVPIIPAAYRPDPAEDYHHLTRLYREVIIANRALRQAKEDPDSEQYSYKLYHLYRAIDRLFVEGLERPRKIYSLIQHLEGKWGLLRHFLLGKRQDFTARAVIVPDPRLTINECGLPLEMAVQLLRGAVRKELERRHITDAERVIAKAFRGSQQDRNRLKKVLEKIIQTQDILVLLNRQPSLHRYSLLAFRPRIRNDYVIALPPLMCGGFNADFDGDTIALHLPLTGKAQEEAKRLLPSRHLFKVANGDLVLNLSQDIVLGAYLLSQEEQGRASLTLMLGSKVEPGVTQSRLSELVSGYIKGFKKPEDAIEGIRRIQSLVLQAATTGEASFSFFDIQAVAFSEHEREDLIRRIDRNFESALDVRVSEVEDRLKAIADEAWKHLKMKNPFARYFLSGARGNKDQLRQIAGMIGYVYREDARPAEKFLTGSFVMGLSKEDYWELCHSTRRTMLDKKLSVGEAGALTRDLIEGAYETVISSEDCGTTYGIVFKRGVLGDALLWALKKRVGVDGSLLDASLPSNIDVTTFLVRSPLTCQEKDGICQRCYGLDLSTGEWPRLGDLVGVIAGQSVGERGTQLSMRTFHTGGLALNIGEVKRLFCNGTLSTDGAPLSLDAECMTGQEGQRLFDIVIPRMLRTYGQAIAPIHFEVLLRAMMRGGHIGGLQGLAMDWRRRGLLAALSYREVKSIIREAVSTNSAIDNLSSPKTWVMTGRRINHSAGAKT